MSDNKLSKQIQEQQSAERELLEDLWFDANETLEEQNSMTPNDFMAEMLKSRLGKIEGIPHLKIDSEIDSIRDFLNSAPYVIDDE